MNKKIIIEEVKNTSSMILYITLGALFGEINRFINGTFDGNYLFMFIRIFGIGIGAYIIILTIIIILKARDGRYEL